jgi:hypothetical protein
MCGFKAGRLTPPIDVFKCHPAFGFALRARVFLIKTNGA